MTFILNKKTAYNANESDKLTEEQVYLAYLAYLDL